MNNVNHKQYSNARDWERPYCHLIIKSRRSLYLHYKECLAKLQLSHNSINRVISDSNIPHAESYKCEFCGHYSSTKGGYTNHKNHCIMNPNRVPGHSHSHSLESKKKLSEARRKNLENGIGNHWICPHIKMSYAEQYFYDCFVNANILFENNVWISHYCVDFLFGTYYFEVDGEQHYTSDGIKHDLERCTFLDNKGYTLISRCRWSWFKSLSDSEKVKYIDDLISKIKQLV